MSQEPERTMRRACAKTQATLSLIDATKQSKKLMGGGEPFRFQIDLHDFDEVEYCRTAKKSGSVVWAY